MNVVGTILFDRRTLDVYHSVDEPLFKGSDVADLISYSTNNVWKMLRMCEADETLTLPLVVAGQKRSVNFVTEAGLYNILSQSRTPTARKWRRVINGELIRLRKDRGNDVVQQFEDWDHEADSIYIDPETGELMQSVTVQGGDVIQIPYQSGGEK